LTGIAYGDARPGRRAVLVSGHAKGAAAGLGDHVKGKVLLERAAFTETLDLGINDGGVDRLRHLIGQAQALNRAGGEVFHHHIRLGDHVLDQSEALGRLQVDGNRFFVGVEDLEIIRIIVRLIGPQAAAGIAPVRVLDFHHVGAKPGEGLGAGRAGLELC